MLNFGNKEFRNLQEQVLKNMNDISDIVNAERVLADFGIKVLGWFESEQALKEAYPEETTTGLEYGDAFAIHEVDIPPYEFYIWTRTEEEGKNGIWFNIGEFPKEGPQGEQGLPGEKGEKGDKGDRGEQGLRGPVGPTGPRGEKGETGENGLQGPKGDKGETGGLIEIIGILDDSQDLPDPVVLDKPDAAYLITNSQSGFDLWIQIGESMEDKQWVDVGAFNKGTAVKINDEIVPVYDATHVVNTEQIVADDVNNIITITTSKVEMPSQGDTTIWKFRPSNGNTFTILNDTTDVVSLGTSSVRVNAHLLPSSGSFKNLGINDANYKWGNLYLSGTAYTPKVQFDSNGTKYIENLTGNDLKVSIPYLLFYGNTIRPESSNASLGVSNRRWNAVYTKDLYLSGNISDGTTTKSISEVLAGGGGGTKLYKHTITGTTMSGGVINVKIISLKERAILSGFEVATFGDISISGTITYSSGAPKRVFKTISYGDAQPMILCISGSLTITDEFLDFAGSLDISDSVYEL